MWDAYKPINTGSTPSSSSGVSVLVDEADKKREELRERWAKGDPTADLTRVVGGSREYRYRGVNKHRRRVERALAQGFEHVPDTDPAQFLGAMGSNKKEMGDLVLMREPLDFYHMKRRRIANKFKDEKQQEADAMTEKMNRMARDAHAVGPHQDSVYDIPEEEI